MEERSRSATSQISVRRGRGVTRKPPAKGAPAKAKAKSAPTVTLVKGQVWKVKEMYVQIVDAGKTLIHYTMSAKPRQRGLRVHMATRETVLAFLKSNQARPFVEQD